MNDLRNFRPVEFQSNVSLRQNNETLHRTLGHERKIVKNC